MYLSRLDALGVSYAASLELIVRPYQPLTMSILGNRICIWLRLAACAYVCALFHYIRICPCRVLPYMHPFVLCCTAFEYVHAMSCHICIR